MTKCAYKWYCNSQMVCHISMVEGFSSVMMTEVVGLQFRGVCSSSESHGEFLWPSPGSENIL